MKSAAIIAQKSRHYLSVARKHYETARRLFFEFIEFMKSTRSDKVYAAFGYFPFIGWLVPLYVREKSEICQQCAKQGLVLSISAALVLIGLFILELFVPRGLKSVMFGMIIITYLFNIFYLILSLYAMYHAVYGRVVRIPVITERSEKLYL